MSSPHMEPRLDDLSTHWSSVMAMRLADEGAAEAALASFLRRYVPAMRAYLVQARRFDGHDADDVVQGFVADRILARRMLDRADRERGSLRGMLKTALIRYAINANRNRRPVPVEAIEACADVTGAASRPMPDAFDIAWAREVLAQALDLMKSSLEGCGKANVWRVFEHRLARPMLDGSPATPYRELVARLGLRDSVEAANLLVTGKRAFVRSLRQVVGEYTSSAMEVEREIQDLRRIAALTV